MGKFKNYIKRGIKYVLHEHKVPIVKVEINQKSPNNIFGDKIYLVTGGGSGLGFYIAKKLVEESAKVVITGRNEEKLKKSKKELGDNCDYFVCDVSDIESSKKMIKETFEKYNKLDGIINNAGISLHEWDFMKVTDKNFDDQFYINLKGSYFLTQEYIRYLENLNLSGNILFISSERGTMVDDLPYGLTKSSINSLVKALSYKYYKKGIRVNAIAPGVTASDMTSVDKNGDLYNDNNSGRFFVPEEVAEVANFLLSDYSKCISGEIIHTNGGNHIKRGY